MRMELSTLVSLVASVWHGAAGTRYCRGVRLRAKLLMASCGETRAGGDVLQSARAHDGTMWMKMLKRDRHCALDE